MFIVFYLTQRGESAGAAGLVLGVSGLGSVIGGHLTDSPGRRPTVLLSTPPRRGRATGGSSLVMADNQGRKFVCFIRDVRLDPVIWSCYQNLRTTCRRPSRPGSAAVTPRPARVP